MGLVGFPCHVHQLDPSNVNKNPPLRILQLVLPYPTMPRLGNFEAQGLHQIAGRWESWWEEQGPGLRWNPDRARLEAQPD